MAALRLRRVVLSYVLVSALGGALEAQVQPTQPPQQVQVSPTPAFHLIHSQNGRTACPDQVPPLLHWPLRDHDACQIEIELNPTIPPGAINPPTPAQVRAVVQAAIDTWNAVDPSLIQLELKAGDSGCTAFIMDGVNCIAFQVFPPNLEKKPAQSAPFGDPATGRLSEADMRLNALPHDETGNPQAWTVNPVCPGAPKYPVGLQNVVLHELGHMIGLAHPNVTGYASCPQHDFGNVTVMHSQYTDPCELELHQADKDGANYLYSADLGDAEDPPYPTLVHDAHGPAHLFGIHTDPSAGGPRYQYEWLALDAGKIDDNAAECEALVPDGDDFDDGVEFIAVCEPDDTLEPPVMVKVGVKTAADTLGKSHDYSSKPMYINGWFDWNDDGDFDDNGEHAIAGASVTAAGVYPYPVTAPDDAPCAIQTRFRLDWNENSGQGAKVDPTLDGVEGSAQHGEVEDHVMVGEPEGGGKGGGGGGGGGDPPSYCHTVTVELASGGTVLVDLGAPCHEPQETIDVASAAVADDFPAAGSECFQTTATTGLDFDLDGVMDETIGLTGPACVRRGDPYVAADGFRTVDTVMTVFELTGYSPTFGPVTMRAVEGVPIHGQIKQSQEALDAGYDIGPDFPATSTFDVVFEVAGDFGVTDPAGPITVGAQLVKVPPVTPSPGDDPPIDARPVAHDDAGSTGDPVGGD